VVVQEQIARTAVLFSTRWHANQDYIINPISNPTVDSSPAGHGFRYYSRSPRSESNWDYSLENGTYSGDWFSSRAIEAQYLETVRPSRATLSVLNADELAAASAAPVVLSSYPQRLDRVYLIDDAGHYWTCSDLDPGRKATCTASNVGDFAEFWTVACKNAGGKLRPVLNRAQGRVGCFYATGSVPEESRLATLAEIHWLSSPGIFLGDWVGIRNGETAP